MFNGKAKSLIITALALGSIAMGIGYLTNADNPVTDVTDTLVKEVTDMSVYDMNSPSSAFGSIDRMESRLRQELNSTKRKLKPDYMIKKIGENIEDKLEAVKDFFD